METSFIENTSRTTTPQPTRNVHQTPNLPPVSTSPGRDCSDGQLLSLVVIILVVALYLSFVMFWLITWKTN